MQLSLPKHTPNIYLIYTYIYIHLMTKTLNILGVPRTSNKTNGDLLMFGDENTQLAFMTFVVFPLETNIPLRVDSIGKV